MPELPDLLYIQRYLRHEIRQRVITAVSIRRPVVIRVAIDEPFDRALIGRGIEDVHVHGPFLRFALSGGRDLILNLMLMGRVQHQRIREKAGRDMCFSLSLDDGSRVNLCDKQMMAKAYLVRRGEYSAIPTYDLQGVDLLSKAFTWELFQKLSARHSRKQVRVFINDHSILSSIGNAYADEILFEAGIHPKTFVGRLSSHDLESLFSSIRSVLAWGISCVQSARQPIHIKVRDHMKVRMRHGEPCPRCGMTIRREGVRGHDVYFCPSCQPASRPLFIDWKKA
jgi:formamidopyrimidine-DNA glycosylase